MKRLLNSPAALVAAWFVVVGVMVGLAAFAFLQPPPPAGGEPVSMALPAETSPEEAAPGEAVPGEAPAEGEAETPPAEPPALPPQ
ncbi:MAG TPA: hypothetical protein VIR45_00860, partial [Kiloniellaceae bacterium]